MNRDDLLDLCFPGAALDLGAKIFDMTETDDDNPQVTHVRSTVTLGYRRVIVHHATAAPGPGVAQAASTLLIATIANVATDPDYRGRGYATALIRSAHEEAATHETIGFVALFAGREIAGFYERLGYARRDGSPEGFMVAPLYREGEDPAEWPVGRVDTRGSW